MVKQNSIFREFVYFAFALAALIAAISGWLLDSPSLVTLSSVFLLPLVAPAFSKRKEL